MLAFCGDHSVPCALVQQHKHQSQRSKRTIYKLDENKFCDLLQRQNWKDILEERSIDERSHLFTKIFMNSAQERMPVKTVSVRSNDAAWMSNEIRELIKQRGKIHKNAKRSNL